LAKIGPVVVEIMAGLPWAWNFYSHTHPIPIPMGIPIPTSDLIIGLTGIVKNDKKQQQNV